MESAFTEEHLGHLQSALDDALDGVPFYSRWKSNDPGPEKPPLERIRSLPTLTRRELRTGFPRLFLPQGRDLKHAMDKGEVEIVATSGTTDDRVQVLWWQPWWDQQEEAQYRSGHTLSQAIWEQQFKEAVLTTPVCSGGVCHIGDLKMEERTFGRMLFLNQKADPVHWTERDIVRMCDELNHYQPDAFEADPAYLAALSRYAVDHKLTLHQPRYIGLTYEFPSRTHVRAIRKAFGSVTLMNSYGSTEAGCLHMNCEHGRLHPNLNWTHVDIVPVQPRHGGPRLGRIVASVLQNPWLKLLRYETGDLGRLAEGPCPCGRPGESLERIEGRIKDVTFKVDGTLCTVEDVDRTLGDLNDLVAYQVVQETSQRYLVHYLPEPGTDESLQSALLERLSALYGGGEINLQRESALTPEPSGKYRLTKCEFPFDTQSVF